MCAFDSRKRGEVKKAPAHTTTLAGGARPELMRRFVSLEMTRAQGRPGARCTRGLVCKIVQRNAHEHTGSAGASRPSLRNGFTAYNALSPATGLFCHRRLAGLTARLDASVGASGPHDFAVRLSAVRQWHLRVHRIPPRVS